MWPYFPHRLCLTCNSHKRCDFTKTCTEVWSIQVWTCYISEMHVWTPCVPVSRNARRTFALFLDSHIEELNLHRSVIACCLQISMKSTARLWESLLFRRMDQLRKFNWQFILIKFIVWLIQRYKLIQCPSYCSEMQMHSLSLECWTLLCSTSCMLCFICMTRESLTYSFHATDSFLIPLTITFLIVKYQWFMRSTSI